MQPATSISTSQHFIQAFSWMLIHSLWQGLLLAVVTAVILMLTKRTKATVRYNLVFVQFALFLLTCGITFIYEWNKSPLQATVPGLADANANGSTLLNMNVVSISHLARICMDYFSANAPMIVLLWFVVFLFRAVKMMGSLVYIHRAKNRLVYQPSEEWKAKVDLLCQKLQLKRAVQLLESGYVKMPMVIGHLKPVILVPVGLLAGLPAGQVEAVLLHELAHIRRNDYVVNFMQTIAETVFFFNPGLLWISSLLRDERENCCDDMALEQTKNKREFIEALISFKEHSLYGSKYEVAFPGKKNHLLNRVSRILNNKNKALAPAEKAFFMAGVIALSAMVATAAIAEVHTAVTKHKKSHPVAVTSTASTTVVTIRSEDVIGERAAKHKASLPIPRSAFVIPAAAPNTTVNLVDAINKMRDRLNTDKTLSISNDDAQSDVQNQQEQSRKDQQDAQRDQAQARLDQIQALKDQEEAHRDQAQAHIVQENARREQNQQNADQARKNEEQAKLNAAQAIRNQLQDVRNQEQAKRNQEQAERNKQQEKLNAEQAIRNQEQAKKSNTSVQE